MLVVESKRLGNGRVQVIIDGSSTLDWRQGDIYEGSDGRRWTFYSTKRELHNCVILEGSGLPKPGKHLVLVNEDRGDAIWLTSDQARAVLHILRTVHIWRKHEKCDRRSGGLDKLAMHDEHLDAAGKALVFDRLRTVGYGPGA